MILKYIVGEASVNLHFCLPGRKFVLHGAQWLSVKVFWHQYEHETIFTTFWYL